MKPALLSNVKWGSLGSPSRGFTLLEIMIALSIAAIIMATGIPAFVRALQKEGLRKAVSDVVEGCSQARAYAILRGTPTELVIRAEDGHLSIQPAKLDAADGFATVMVSQEAQSPSPSASAPLRFSGQIPDNVAVKLVAVNFQELMDQPEVRVRFFPSGTCDEFTIVLTSEKGEQKISLDVITALADVEVLR